MGKIHFERYYPFGPVSRTTLVSAGMPMPPLGKDGWPWSPINSVSNQAEAAHVPLISVVTPSFNQAHYIEETIRSVLLQGYPNIEYILMDGGSTDGSTEILQQYRPYFKYLHIGPDGGQASAIAEGFNHSNGEILAWLNADDIYLPGALFRVAAFFKSHPAHVLVGGDVKLIDEDGNEVGLLRAVRSQLFLTKNTGGHGWWQPGTFWRQNVYKACGGVDPSFSFCMDRDLFIRLCSLGRSGCLPGPPVAAFRVHQRQKSQTLLKRFYEENEVLFHRYGIPGLSFTRPFLGRLWQAWALWNILLRYLYNQIEG